MNLELTVENKQIIFEVVQKDAITLTVGNPSISIVNMYEEGDYIPKSVINAKGDIIVGNEDAEPMRLPIGSPGYFPVVDPSQDRGIKYTNEIDGGTF